MAYQELLELADAPHRHGARDRGPPAVTVAPAGSSYFFPLSPSVEWTYVASTPMEAQLVTVRLEPPTEIEVSSLVRPEVRREWAWVLRRSGRETPIYALERADGVELVERRTFGNPERRGLIVTTDLRWGGLLQWIRPHWHYDLQFRQYHRVGQEQLTVAAGVFPCVKILVGEGEDEIIWIAPGVGIVRSVARVEGLAPFRYSVLELHSYQPPSQADEPRRFCLRCGRAFREAENDDAACRYHPGRFLDYDSLGSAGIGAAGDFWDCCMRQVELGEPPWEVPACATGRHLSA